jgi:hypothetical protein
MSRTTRKDWLFIVGAFCCACALSACRHTDQDFTFPPRFLPADTGPGSPSEEKKSFSELEHTGLIRGNEPTPYHALPTPALPAREEHPDTKVHQATAPLPNEQEPLKLDLHLPDPPGQATTPSSRPEVKPQVLQFDKVKPAPAQPEAPLLVALRYALENKPSKAIEALQKYDKPNQDMLLCLMALAQKLHEISLDKACAKDITHMEEQLDSMREHLEDRTELAIAKMVFCERIQDFGRYTALEDDHEFYPSTRQRKGELVQVYVELRNLKPVKEKKGPYYETQIDSRVEIQNEKEKKPTWWHNFDDGKRVILTQTRRHDFYNNYSFYVPDLPSGHYFLTIYITDKLTGRTAANSLRFHVSSAPRPRFASARSGAKS